MRIALGWLTFILAGAFALGLLLSLEENVWGTLPNQRALVGFCGFGLPMIFAAWGTAALWSGAINCQKLLSWSSTLVALASGICLLLVVIEGVANGGSNHRLSVGHFFGFGTTMLLCGTFGIVTLLELEKKHQ
jgi:hypothetical protein